MEKRSDVVSDQEVMSSSRGRFIVREGLLGQECTHGFSTLHNATPYVRSKNRLVGTMSNAIKDLIEVLPIINRV